MLTKVKRFSIPKSSSWVVLTAKIVKVLDVVTDGEELFVVTIVDELAKTSKIQFRAICDEDVYDMVNSLYVGSVFVTDKGDGRLIDDADTFYHIFSRQLN